MKLRYLHLQQKDRPASDVPKRIKILLVLALAMQLIWQYTQPPITPTAENLPPPLSVHAYTLISLGEPVAASRFLNLWLQAFDNQPGISLSFHQLDYVRITQWLDTILDLDPRGHYPMLMAARVYGSVQDPEKQRIMMDYVYERFKQNPDKHWRWLAHVVITAKHELNDLDLALKYASALSEKATASHVPRWARDMHIIVLEDMGQLQAAKILAGALIDSNVVTDPYELKFLVQKVIELEEKLLKNRQNVGK